MGEVLTTGVAGDARRWGPDRSDHADHDDRSSRGALSTRPPARWAGPPDRLRRPSSPRFWRACEARHRDFLASRCYKVTKSRCCMSPNRPSLRSNKHVVFSMRVRRVASPHSARSPTPPPCDAKLLSTCLRTPRPAGRHGTIDLQRHEISEAFGASREASDHFQAVGYESRRGAWSLLHATGQDLSSVISRYCDITASEICEAATF